MEKQPWQQYLDGDLMAVGKIDKAAILDLTREGKILAKSASFSITQGEASTLAKNYDNESDLYKDGVQLEGQKFVVAVAMFGSVVFGQGEGSERGYCLKAGDAVLIGLCSGYARFASLKQIIESLGRRLDAIFDEKLYELVVLPQID